MTTASAATARLQRLSPIYQRGFTLMELLVVVLIIALLTGIVAPRLMGQVARSEITAAQAQLSAVSKALQAYRLDVGRFPTTEEGLDALLQRSGNDPRWRGPYLQAAVPDDPWGMPYQYAAPGPQGEDFLLWSLGRDRKSGGEGDDADLYGR